MKSELSKKNEYWLPKHRYYELKHFCLQYQYWKLKIAQLTCYITAYIGARPVERTHDSPTEKCVMLRQKYKNHIDTVTKAANLTDSELGPYILKGVTLGYSYEQLQTQFQIPCSRSVYYQLYRKFFYILSHTQESQPL